MTAELHHAAIMARIRADSQLTATTYELGEVPDPAPSRYVVVQSDLGQRSQARFSGGKVGLLTRHYVYCVGMVASQARWVGGRIEAQLLDYQLTVTGRNVRKPAEWYARPVILDKDGPFPLPFGVIVFDLYSEPSA
ncbi:hypothetical protein [Agromyces sp. CF514]|uniref:hypothetical protein n=1 Tax=Agromyces sp. CF514 TaxID=1881031 RepID=UPI000B87785E|nr:hypothetical protein [Agromyces sp. CF514]